MERQSVEFPAGWNKGDWSEPSLTASAVGASVVSPARERWVRVYKDAQNVIHIVFSTKDRRKAIPEEFQPKLWAYSAGICKKQGIFVHAIGGMEDHAHFLIQVPPVIAVAMAVASMKSNSSRWANEEGHKLAWQKGYAAFSVSASIVPVVVRYIQNQQAHHRKMSFDEEFVALLRKHGVGFDPQFVFG
jgi:REP element-mobilizing transposase RayT